MTFLRLIKPTYLDELAVQLRQSLSTTQKQDIHITNKILGLKTSQPIPVGDDCAAIPDGDGYLLLAAEGMWHVLVETDVFWNWQIDSFILDFQF